MLRAGGLRGGHRPGRVGPSGRATGLHASRAGARGGIAVNAPDKLPPETRQPVSGYLWGALAVLT
ncbi:hypothetical protein N0P26_002954 [Acinetobacter baumannii]|uniref:hypothetical protein n=1 Tax=Acinetobacter TaxID=469 RepID=UPI003CC7AD2C